MVLQSDISFRICNLTPWGMFIELQRFLRTERYFLNQLPFNKDPEAEFTTHTMCIVADLNGVKDTIYFGISSFE